MQIKETPDVSFPRVVESFPLEDAVVLADNAGVALGVQRAFSARVRSVRDDGSGLNASKCVEIPLVGRDGEISGVLCRTAPRSDTRGVFSSRGPERVRAIGDVARFVVHDINNLLAVIGTGLQLLESRSDAACRKAILSKMQHAITRGALLSHQLLDAARPFPESVGGIVAGNRLAALADTLDQALRPDITVRTDIAPDLWDFDADPEELYFALSLSSNASAEAKVRLSMPWHANSRATLFKRLASSSTTTTTVRCAILSAHEAPKGGQPLICINGESAGAD
ncbi:hypothetical protein IVB18_12395 [Bradyrhizobium sp. 186]|uniref:hypothetical protein n=1 Tax=Bradyrhizobium sp. 186 TaxID=2782654 RepID=UPI00200150CD|nr:hypothetical protein [Bradyrhizobium sp. 186]UPK38012.1 hypothetical protein IVB18_12395 [Bradyrhizobium sp. 186]